MNTPKKNKWIIPTIIIVVVVAALVVTGIFVVPKLFNNSSDTSSSEVTSEVSSNTPEEAVKSAVNGCVTKLKSTKSTLKTALMKKVTSSSSNLSSSDRQMLESIVDESLDVLLDSVDFDVKDATINGDTATVTVTFTMVDYSKLSSALKSLKTYKSGDIKKLAQSYGTTSTSKDIKVHKENGAWVAETQDIEAKLNLMFGV